MTVFGEQSNKVYININETWFTYFDSLASYNSSKKVGCVRVCVHTCMPACVCIHACLHVCTHMCVHFRNLFRIPRKLTLKTCFLGCCYFLTHGLWWSAPHWWTMPEQNIKGLICLNSSWLHSSCFIWNLS